MPNPYHDETGKFCSKGEMQQAIVRLVETGKFDEAMQLTSELKAITEPKETPTVVEKQPVKKIRVNKKANTTAITKIITSNPKDFETYNREDYQNSLQEAIEDSAKMGANATMFDISRSNKTFQQFGRFPAGYLTYVDNIAKHRMNVQELKNSDSNLLKDPTNNTWEARYKQAVAEFMVEKGKPRTLRNDGYLGWHDYELEAKPKNIVAVFSFKEDEWAEFAGTFVETNEDHYGVSAEVLYSDGSSRELRWEGKMSDIIKNITKTN